MTEEKPQKTPTEEIYDLLKLDYDGSTTLIESNKKDIERFEKMIAQLEKECTFQEVKRYMADNMMSILWKYHHPDQPYEHKKNAINNPE